MEIPRILDTSVDADVEATPASPVDGWDQEARADQVPSAPTYDTQDAIHVAPGNYANTADAIDRQTD